MILRCCFWFVMFSQAYALKCRHKCKFYFTYLVTIAKCGGFIHAPINNTRFSCRVFLSMATSSLKADNCAALSVPGSILNILMATSPCHWPLENNEICQPLYYMTRYTSQPLYCVIQYKIQLSV